MTPAQPLLIKERAMFPYATDSPRSSPRPLSRVSPLYPYLSTNNGLKSVRTDVRGLHGHSRAGRANLDESITSLCVLYTV